MEIGLNKSRPKIACSGGPERTRKDAPREEPTVDDEEGGMRRRGARECEEALMEATEARRGYARVAAWDRRG